MKYVICKSETEADEVIAENSRLGNSTTRSGSNDLGEIEVRVWSNGISSIYVGKNDEGLAIYEGDNLY